MRTSMQLFFFRLRSQATKNGDHRTVVKRPTNERNRGDLFAAPTPNAEPAARTGPNSREPTVPPEGESREFHPFAARRNDRRRFARPANDCHIPHGKGGQPIPTGSPPYKNPQVLLQTTLTTSTDKLSRVPTDASIFIFARSFPVNWSPHDPRGSRIGRNRLTHTNLRVE